MRRWRRGFTLIELLIVVAIIGIIVAISMFNMLNAIQRAKQKRSMADMRNVAIAVEAYQTDFNQYPAAAAYVLPSGLSLPSGTLGVIATFIAPTYIRTVPMADGWDSWFTYGTSTGKNDYLVRSNGRDGAPESTPAFGPTTDLNSDIILVDGAFVQYPAGVQR